MRKRLVAICVLITVLVSACGGGGKTAGPEESKPAQEENSPGQEESSPGQESDKPDQTEGAAAGSSETAAAEADRSGEGAGEKPAAAEPAAEEPAADEPVAEEPAAEEPAAEEEPTKTMQYGGVTFEVPASWEKKDEEKGLTLVPNERSLVKIQGSSVEMGVNAEENIQKMADQFPDQVVEVNGKTGVFEDSQGKTDSGSAINRRLYCFSPNETWIMVIDCRSLDEITFDSFIETLDFSEAVTVAPRKPELSMELFNRIEEGMSYEELKGIFGEDGKKTSETSIMDSTLTSYQWGTYSKGITVELVDDEVSGKSQMGLGSSSTPTLDAYSECEVGMSYEDVAGLLGEGELISVAWVLGIRTDMYTWGSGLKLVTMMFQDGKLASKSQIGLD